MNLEQLQAMSDAELNELSAVKVMGSELRQFAEWDKTPINFPIIAYSPSSDRLILWKNSKEDGITWNPTTDMNDAMRLLGKYMDWAISIEHGLNDWNVRLSEGYIKGSENVSVEDKSASRAITIASILALE